MHQRGQALVSCYEASVFVVATRSTWSTMPASPETLAVSLSTSRALDPSPKVTTILALTLPYITLLLYCCHSLLSLPDSSWPHELQHARLPCPSLSSGVCLNSCLLSRWCHPTISSSVTPFFPCFPSFPASGSFSMSWLFASGGQSIGASVSASVLPMNIQGWFTLGLTGLTSLLSKELSRVFSSSTVWIVVLGWYCIGLVKKFKDAMKKLARMFWSIQ